MKREKWKQLYTDFKVLSAMIDGKDFEQGYQLLKTGKHDVMNKDDELYDINFGKHGCFTIFNENGKGFLSDCSIEVWDGDEMLGNYTLKRIMQYGGIEK